MKQRRPFVPPKPATLLAAEEVHRQAVERHYILKAELFRAAPETAAVLAPFVDEAERQRDQAAADEAAEFRRWKKRHEAA